MAGAVSYEVEGAVATVTITRPDSMNSLTQAAKEQLLAAVTRATSDPAVRAVILTGTGRAFTVGQDLREHAAMIESGDPAPMRTVRDHYNPLVRLLREAPKPVIAAINGTAAGAGLGIALACDLRIAADTARFTTAFAGIGLSVDSGLSWTLPRFVGAGGAAALLMLAEPFTAAQALELGLVNLVVPADAVAASARELATRLAAGPTAAYASIKAALDQAASVGFTEALEFEDAQQSIAGATADHRAAVKAFLAKEPPLFEGR
jgi:2-(1,2-epoxy-1,2-dihydrophenyl)acetyl-CoA isomerase